MADQFKVATESKLIHRFNRANTKMFVYRHILDKEPFAIFTKQGNLLVHEGRRFKGVAAALESLDNPHIKVRGELPKRVYKSSLTEEQKKQIITLWNAGKNTIEIATEIAGSRIAVIVFVRNNRDLCPKRDTETEEVDLN